jgi:hypothetical protein
MNEWITERNNLLLSRWQIARNLDTLDQRIIELNFMILGASVVAQKPTGDAPAAQAVVSTQD